MGYLSVYAGGGQTNNIYEPIFYCFNRSGSQFMIFQPTIPSYLILSLILIMVLLVRQSCQYLLFQQKFQDSLRQVVKLITLVLAITFLLARVLTIKFTLIRYLKPGTNGTYQGIIYIVSPTTKLTNTAYNPNNTSNFALVVLLLIQIGYRGNTSNLYYVGANGFTINQVGGANTASVAQGNQNDILVGFWCL